jgi:hypothetical protein
LFTPPERVKRGILDLGGDILKFLFGTLTPSDAQKCTEHKEIRRRTKFISSHFTGTNDSFKVSHYLIQHHNAKGEENERVLAENLHRLNKIVVDEINQMQNQLDSVLVLNEDIQQVQRGLDECQHTFEILVDAFLHAQDGVIQPQLITKVKDMMKSLPDGLDFPSFPSLELSRLISPIIFSQKSYLVYVLQILLIKSTTIYCVSTV